MSIGTASISSAISTAFPDEILESKEQSGAFWDADGAAFIESATQYAEVGKFQILLLIVCLIAYSNSSTFPNILIKFSSAIECDHQLIKDDKKAINDVVYVCMVVGGAAWSLLADTLSRKWTLILILLTYAISTVGFAFAHNFLWLGVFRGISSFCRSGIICITIVFISEFQISYFRGSMICYLQLAWIIGIVAIPGLAYGWRSLIIIAVIPALTAVLGLVFFPDSPRFLLSRGREKEAIRSLQMIHAINTGTTKIDFPIRHLKDNRTVEDIRSNSVVKAHIPDHLEPKFICIPIVMLTQFVIMFSYCTLSLWFPYMTARTEAFFPVARVDEIPQDCRLGAYYMNEDLNKSNVLSNVEFLRGDDTENDTIHVTLSGTAPMQPENPCNNDDRKRVDRKSATLVAMACMPSLIFLVLKIDTMGRQFFITMAQVVAGCLAFASYFMHNVGKDLLFCCVFDSVTLISSTVAQCMAVELFPTRVRVLGVALVIGSGQLGAILADIGGAISFGLSCAVVMALIAISLASSKVGCLVYIDLQKDIEDTFQPYLYKHVGSHVHMSVRKLFVNFD